MWISDSKILSISKCLWERGNLFVWWKWAFKMKIISANKYVDSIGNCRVRWNFTFLWLERTHFDSSYETNFINKPFVCIQSKSSVIFVWFLFQAKKCVTIKSFAYTRCNHCQKFNDHFDSTVQQSGRSFFCFGCHQS